MRITCPSCHAETSLDALLESEAARRAVARLVEHSVPFGALVLRYVALHRPPKRRLSIERMVALVEELLADMQRAAVTRKGRDWPAPRETWQAALETVLAARDKGALTLPLSGHGYLHEVIVAQADKAEAAAEREREAQRRSRSHVAGVRPAGDALDAAAGVHVLVTAPPPPPAYSGPSRAAMALQAEFRARAARGAPVDTTEEAPRDPQD